MSEKKDRRMAEALTGVRLAEQWPNFQKLTKLLEQRRPPSYLVRAALERVFGHRFRSMHDKSAWSVAFTYKDEVFELSDWKNSTWNIYGHKTGGVVAAELERKVSAAAKILDGHLKDVCSDLRKKGDLSLDNQFHRYHALFDMFRHECEKQLGFRPEPARQKTRRHPSGVVEVIESTMAALMDSSFKAQGNLLAAVIFFFSLSEVIFDACFALSDRQGVDYKAFRDLSWEERFKSILRLTSTWEKKVYERLLPIRRFYRNIPVHADPVYAFFIKGIGLIPATFDHLSNPNLIPLGLSNNEEAKVVLGDLEEALEFFRDHPLTRYGFAYAESGLVIHLSPERLKRHREHMTSIEGFREYLEGVVERADAAADLVG